MYTFEDCERELINRGGQKQLAKWAPSAEVRAFTLAFAHTYGPMVTLDELKSVQQANAAKVHPLGHIPASAAIRQIDNLAPDFPINYLFHLYLEQRREVPTWEQFLAFIMSPEHRAKCYFHFERKLAGLGAAYSEERKQQALQWRLGNSYNSCLRELHFAATLRETADLQLRFHLFADVQLQTDFWLGDVLYCLRVPSSKLERKPNPKTWAGDRFAIVNINIGHQGFDQLWLPTEQQYRVLPGLSPELGTITTIYPDGTMTIDRPRKSGEGSVPVAFTQIAVANAVKTLALPGRPRYSLTLATQAPVDMANIFALLTVGVKVVLFHPDMPKWSELDEFRKARLLQTLPLPVELQADVANPCAVVDGQANPAELVLLDRLGKAVPKFNFEQWQVEHARNDCHCQVGAGAGTGKTAVMKDRVMKLLHTVDGLSLRDITMVTFTREATRVMRERLRRELEIRFRLTGDARYLEWLEDLSFMQVSTIPSFARRLLQAVGSQLGYGQNFRIREFGQERKAVLAGILDAKLEHARQNNRLQDLLRVPLYRFVDVANRYWQEMENKGLGPKEIASLDWGTVTDPACRDLQDIWPGLFKEAELQLQQLKERTNAISLSDLTRQIQRVSSELGGLSRTGLTIKYLFVDEFQDSDDTQIRLVAALQKQLGAHIFVVGDVKQSIYRFRGATHTAFEVLKARLADNGAAVTTFMLRKNYRTSKVVLEQLVPYFERWGDNKWLPYIRSEGLVGVVDEPGELRIEPSDEKETSAQLRKLVLGWIKEARDSAGIDSETNLPGRVAVLVRTNEQAALIKKWCDDDGVFCQIDRGGTLFASQAAHDFHALVAGLLYPDEPLAMLNLLATPFSDVRLPWPALLPLKGDRDELRAFLSGYKPCTGWTGLLEKSRTEPVLSLLRAAMESMHPTQRYFDLELEALRAQYPQKDPAELRQEAVARAGQYQLNLDRIMELLHTAFNEQFATLYGVHAWLETQQATNRTESEPALPAAGQKGRVLCVTVHRAKGDEFHTVIVPFTYKRFRVPGSELLLDEHNGKWSAGWMLQVWTDDQPLRYRNDHHQRLESAEASEAFLEETRLLYVAVTRTQRRLWIVRYEKGNENWGRLLRLDR